VRTADDVDRMIQAGATRIGASASVAIVRGQTEKADPKAGPKRAVGGY
jgi:deoxyribose-phosphate aldolase